VVWIGYLQWKYRNGIPFENEIPILEPLDNVRHMDAILDRTDPANPKDPEWPEADVIVGNPPFLGGKKLRTGLGDNYVDQLFKVYDGRVRHEADLCCYWHEKARAVIAGGKSALPAGRSGRNTLDPARPSSPLPAGEERALSLPKGQGEGEARTRAVRVGLLATQGIRGGANRDTLKRIKGTGDIFFAESDRAWILDGAAVRVSMVGFDDGSEKRRVLDGTEVSEINANLTAATADLTGAKKLKENLGICFQGMIKGGPFDISETTAKDLHKSPNPHGRPNSEVVVPWINALDIVRRPQHKWIVDFGVGTAEVEAALFEAPFEHVKTNVLPFRTTVRRKAQRERWWIHAEARPGLRRAITGLPRFVVTPAVAKHRIFVWVKQPIVPEHSVFVFARDDDYFFGVLHSRAHEVWALATGTQLESRPRYTPTTTFETFPFPRPTDAQKAAIAAAAKELNELRENWLNPPEGSLSTKELNRRTLTNLYNQRPTWLVNAHKMLDNAVFAAYGWPDNLSDEDMLARLLELNLQREPA
jgi:type II restriction/modification system DNA methylase subunit YeeA